MRCSQCNSARLEKRVRGFWCAECRNYVTVFDETARPKTDSTRREARGREAAATTNPAAEPTAADPESAAAEATSVPGLPPPLPERGGHLVECPMCAHPISPEAVSCPACGQPLREVADMSTMKVLRIIFWVIIGLVVGYIMVKALFISIADAYIHSR